MKLLHRFKDTGLNVSDAIDIEHLDVNIRESLLWHGTSRASVEAILGSGFFDEISSGASAGGRFGKGIYFSDKIETSLAYSLPDENGLRYMLLCRVVCGNFEYVEKSIDEDASSRAHRHGKHSVVAIHSKAGACLKVDTSPKSTRTSGASPRPSLRASAKAQCSSPKSRPSVAGAGAGFREFIALSPHQVYPEYIVVLKTADTDIFERISITAPHKPGRKSISKAKLPGKKSVSRKSKHRSHAESAHEDGQGHQSHEAAAAAAAATIQHNWKEYKRKEQSCRSKKSLRPKSEVSADSEDVADVLASGF